jgi:transposase
MWTKENRRRYDRSGLRYESDLTDDEWAKIAPLLPPAKPGGNKRSVNLREVVNGLMYILSTGCQWRAIPKDLAGRSTVYDYFDRWSWDGTLERIHHSLYVKCREDVPREASPTAAIIDAQSVKSAEKGGAHIDPHGYDAGKKIKPAPAKAGARSATLWSTRMDWCCMPSLPPPMFRTVTEGLGYWVHCSACIPSC